jgi:short-subunit dehydrogenase
MMIVSFMVPNALITAATTAALSVCFSRMDCSPSLWLYDRWTTQRRVSNKRIWIIGASSGIGRELALQLSEHNNDLILSARNETALHELARHIRCSQTLVVDVTNTSQLLHACKDIGSVDICVLNAGQGHLSLALETPPHVAANMLAGNALYPMVVIPNLHNLGCRHFVVTSSIAGNAVPVPLSGAYAASKAALNAYVRSLQAETDTVRVDLICPGPVDTNFHTSQQTTTITKSRSPLKMAASRCAALMIAAMSRTCSGQEVWLCPQPTLMGLYIQQWLPPFVQKWLMRKIGQKRVAMFQQGLDLYDPESWKQVKSDTTK